MVKYKENEIKVLEVNPIVLKEKLENLGAKKVYDDKRIIISLDTLEKKFLNQYDKLIRITEEGSTKVSMHVHQSTPNLKEVIKFKVSRLKETLDFFREMGLVPITKVTANRISYELGKIDFDIDEFSEIPPFFRNRFRISRRGRIFFRRRFKKIRLRES